MDDDGAPLGPVGETMQAAITAWQTQHALTKEALLKCLKPGDLVKVLPFRNSAAAICSNTWCGEEFKPERGRLFVIDGSKALRAAINAVFGSATLVQRCRQHKLRNVADGKYSHYGTYRPLQSTSTGTGIQ